MIKFYYILEFFYLKSVYEIYKKKNNYENKLLFNFFSKNQGISGSLN
jgi:hypothetical protein